MSGSSREYAIHAPSAPTRISVHPGAARLVGIGTFVCTGVATAIAVVIAQS